LAEIRFEGVTKRFKDGMIAVDDLSLTIPDGEFIALVGPSGCGKTTALRMIAGFEDVTEGRIVLGDRVVNDVDPARRDIAMVFQSYALYPHMSVADNIGFPLKMRGVPKQETARQVAEVARLLGLEGMLTRKPSELSGGQRQRVAMGRAIIRHPQAFLLDEPLSNLDANRRTEMRAELARLHARLGVTTIYVTHDQTEAMTLGSRIAVLRDGVIQQVGAPQALYREPTNVFVARFIGSPSMNLMQGRLHERTLTIGASAWTLPDDAPAGAGDVLVGVRPESWRLGAPPEPHLAVGIRGVVEVVEDLGNETVVYFGREGAVRDAIDEGDVFIARIAAGVALRPGDPIELHAALTSLHLFESDTGTRFTNHHA
jgi:multiple sugar transport system ATP-binding protein